MPIVTLTNVSKTYPPRTREGSEVVAVDDVSLEIEKATSSASSDTRVPASPRSCG